jgi:hypothetical protein
VFSITEDDSFQSTQVKMYYFVPKDELSIMFSILERRIFAFLCDLLMRSCYKDEKLTTVKIKKFLKASTVIHPSLQNRGSGSALLFSFQLLGVVARASL